MAATMKRTTRKKTERITEQASDEDREPGVVYIGHVPHGFYEKELFKYFSQFGKVLKIKLSRSKKTGNSKGYAFIKFKYAAVARTVAETCHNYLFYNKLLKCEFKKMDEVHQDTFFSYKIRPNRKSKQQHNAAKSEEKVVKSTLKAVSKQKKKMQKLKELGVDLNLNAVVDVPEVSPEKMKMLAEAKKTKSPKKPIRRRHVKSTGTKKVGSGSKPSRVSVKSKDRPKRKTVPKAKTVVRKKLKK